jgi:hypothetical protein
MCAVEGNSARDIPTKMKTSEILELLGLSIGTAKKSDVIATWEKFYGTTSGSAGVIAAMLRIGCAALT